MSLVLASPQPLRPPRWGAPLSLLAHGGLLAVLSLLTLAHPLEAPPPPASISVELVPPEPAPILPPRVAPQPLQSPVAPLAAPAAPPTTGAPGADRPRPAPPDAAMTEASKFFATQFLRDPANAKIRATLSKMATGEQLVQLCNMEGLEQIRLADRRFDPDILMSYALADTAASADGLTLTADGGAFHSGGNWYAIRLACTISPDHLGVTRFAFKIGNPIPKALWAAHNLEAQYDDAD